MVKRPMEGGIRMIDEEWMSANPGIGSCDALGTYAGDRIEELESEIKRLREIEEAAREYRQASLNSMQTRIYGYELHTHEEKIAATKLDALLGKGEAK